ncbi:hypothetical protein LG315_06505 [Microbacterium marinum]
MHLAPAKKPTVKTFANCSALNKVHKGGVAKAGVKDDKDGIACEKG